MSKGILAGFAATAVLSMFMIMKSIMGVMPAFNVIADWVKVLSDMGLPATPLIAWILHFVLGAVVWGGLFAALNHRLPGSYPVKGIVFGIAAWLAMMVTFMPLAGNGMFALGIGPMVTMMTLVLHVIFGAVLGFVYAKLVAST